MNHTEAYDAYQRDGFVLFQNVLDKKLLAEAGRHVAWLMERNPGRRPEALDCDLVYNDPFWVRLVSDPRLLKIVEQFIGSDIALFASHYICKPAGDGRKVLWHQDGSYWPLEPMEVITLWLAVDDSSPENGCMRVIPGTQNTELQSMKPRQEESVLGSAIDDEWVDESRAVDCILAAGGVSVHHPNVIHGSNANLSEKRRCGLTIRYIPTSTRICVSGYNLTPEGRWKSAYLLQGKPVEGVNDYNPRPRYIEGVHMPFEGCEEWR